MTKVQSGQGMGKGSRFIIRYLIGIIAGLIAASAVGLTALQYIVYTSVSLVVCLLLLATFGVALVLRDPKAAESFAGTMTMAVCLVVGYKLGFSFYQMAVLTVVGAVNAYVWSFILPINPPKPKQEESKQLGDSPRKISKIPRGLREA